MSKPKKKKKSAIKKKQRRMKAHAEQAKRVMESRLDHR